MLIPVVNSIQSSGSRRRQLATGEGERHAYIAYLTDEGCRRQYVEVLSANADPCIHGHKRERCTDSSAITTGDASPRRARNFRRKLAVTQVGALLRGWGFVGGRRGGGIVLPAFACGGGGLRRVEWLKLGRR